MKQRFARALASVLYFLARNIESFGAMRCGRFWNAVYDWIEANTGWREMIGQ